MRTRKVKYEYPRIPGTINANILVPQPLHEAMKAIQRARRLAEGADVTLSRLYKEAVELYINAEPQRRLLRRSKENAA